MTKNRVIAVVKAAVDDFNLSQPESRQLTYDESTVLLGPEATLDSAGLVMVVVTVEELLEEEFGVVSALSTEKAMSQKHSPFRTLGTLVEFITQVVTSDAR